jgi:hypothetical protein
MPSSRTSMLAGASPEPTSSNDAFGARCVFESSPCVVAERPDIEPQWFAQTGFTLAVLKPGKPTGMYHAESGQEDFLVLSERA